MAGLVRCLFASLTRCQKTAANQANFRESLLALWSIYYITTMYYDPIYNCVFVNECEYVCVCENVGVSIR